MADKNSENVQKRENIEALYERLKTSYFEKIYYQNIFLWFSQLLSWTETILDPSYFPLIVKIYLHPHQLSKETYVRGQFDIGTSKHLLSSFLSCTQYWEDLF